MTARFSWIPGKTGGHRPPLQCLLWLVSSRNRGKNRNRVPVFHLGFQILLVPDIVFVDENVNEALYALSLIEDSLTEPFELSIHFSKDFAHRGAFDFDFGLARRYRSQRGWNLHNDAAHFESPSSVTRGS